MPNGMPQMSGPVGGASVLATGPVVVQQPAGNAQGAPAGPPVEFHYYDEHPVNLLLDKIILPILFAKPEKIGNEKLGEAIGGAALGKALPFPFGPIAGAAGAAIFPSKITGGTLAGYLATAGVVNKIFLGAAPLVKLPAGVGGLLKFFFGPLAVAGTVGGTIYFKANPLNPNGPPIFYLLKSFLTGNLDEQPLLPSWLGFGPGSPWAGWQDELDAQFGYGEEQVLELMPKWGNADP